LGSLAASALLAVPATAAAVADVSRNSLRDTFMLDLRVVIIDLDKVEGGKNGLYCPGRTCCYGLRVGLLGG
jgi:hypothetical protein